MPPEIINLSYDTPKGVDVQSCLTKTAQAEFYVLSSDGVDEAHNNDWEVGEERETKRAKLMGEKEDRCVLGQSGDLIRRDTDDLAPNGGEDNDDDDEEEEEEEEADRSRGLSKQTSKLLAELNPNPKTKAKGHVTKKTLKPDGAENETIMTSKGVKEDVVLDNAHSDQDDSEFNRPVKRTVKPKVREPKTQQRADPKVQREQDKRAKEREKVAERERKLKIKEEKAREKKLAADLAQANKSRTDKKVSTCEMVVDLPSPSLDETTALGKQIYSFLKALGVDISYYPSPIPNVIKWRRKVTAVYNRELGHWEPVKESIRDENHALCLMSAQEFVDLACLNTEETDGRDLDAHVLKMASRYEDHKLVYLIEGLTNWMRKNKNVRNRAYRAEILTEMENQNNNGDDGGPSKPQGRRKKPTPAYIDEDMIEDALLKLQVVHKCLIHHTSTLVETAEWVSIFTQHISTIPYRCV